MNNAKLTVSDMKEMIDIFIKYKLNAIRIGDFELQKSHYEPDPSSDKKTSLQEDPLFYSAASQLPPEVQEELSRMMSRK